MSNEEVIATLLELLAACKTGERDFVVATSAVETPQLKSLLARYARQRTKLAGELEHMIARLGGRPKPLAGTPPGWHTAPTEWMENEATALAKCRRNEDEAKSRYQHALQQ